MPDCRHRGIDGCQVCGCRSYLSGTRRAPRTEPSPACDGSLPLVGTRSATPHDGCMRPHTHLINCPGISWRVLGRDVGTAGGETVPRGHLLPAADRTTAPSDSLCRQGLVRISGGAGPPPRRVRARRHVALRQVAVGRRVPLLRQLRMCHRQGISPQIHVLHIGKHGSTQACSQSLSRYRIVFNFSRQLTGSHPA